MPATTCCRRRTQYHSACRTDRSCRTSATIRRAEGRAGPLAREQKARRVVNSGEVHFESISPEPFEALHGGQECPPPALRALAGVRYVDPQRSRQIDGVFLLLHQNLADVL